MEFLAQVAEQKIRAALERGELDSPAYHGKPLQFDNMPGVPDTLRMGYKILKNAGVLPEEMQAKKEMLSLQKLLDTCYDAEEGQRLRRKMNEMILRYNMMMERRYQSSDASPYHAKIMRKLGA